MADTGIATPTTLKRKNKKGLSLAAPTPPPPRPAEAEKTDLEIGIEYKLDLKREDLEVLKDLGHGNGGTVSKVRHLATNMVMARKVCQRHHSGKENGNIY